MRGVGAPANPANRSEKLTGRGGVPATGTK